MKNGVKPVVHYDHNEWRHIMVGFPAIVHPIDHPSALVSNKNACETSTVLRLTDTGFETVNSTYVAMVRGESGWVLK